MAKDTLFITKNYDPLILKTVVRRNIIWLIGIVLLALTAAFFYLRYSKPIFQSSIVIQLNHDDKAKDVLQFENLNNDPSLNSDMELLKSQLIFERAISRLNLNVSMYHEGNILSEEKYLSGDFLIVPYALMDSSLVGHNIQFTFTKPNSVTLTCSTFDKPFTYMGKINEHIKTPYFDIVVKIPKGSTIFSQPREGYYFSFNSVSQLTTKFLGNLTVSPLDEAAKTIMLDFKSYNSQMCKDFLNSLVYCFFEYDLEQKRKGSENILKYIDNQLDSLSNELEASKDDLILFQRNANIIDPDITETRVSGSILKYQEELTVQQQELRLIQNVNAKLKTDPSRLEVYRLLPEMFGSTFEEALSRRINELHEMLEKKEDLLYSVTEDNPQIKTLNSRIQVKMASIRKSASIIEDRLKENIRTLQNKMEVLQGESYSVPEKKLEFGRLQNIQELNEKYFTLFTERKVVYGISDAGFSSNHRVLSRAQVNVDPISPNNKKTYLIAMALGGFSAFLLLFFRYIRFNEINSNQDLKNILPPKISFLGNVPKLDFDMDFSKIIVEDHPKSIESEAFRAIRTNLSFVNPRYQTIAITSSVSSEGKTFVALNLAAILAMANKKTLIIDLDMRKPKVHLAMGSSNAIGMSNAIIGQTAWHDCINPTGIENLDFISAGTIPPNPAELILSEEFERILEEMKEEYDIVVFDNPPVGVVSDGIHVLSQADVPIYIFRANYSKRNYSERVEELMEVQKIKKLNIILNGTDSMNNAYGYGYNHKNNLGYYIDSPRKKSFLKRIFGK